MEKRFKLLICVIIVLINIAIGHYNISTKALDKINYDFNDITEEECVDFVKKYNIEIPLRLKTMQNEGSVSKEIIQIIYNNPSYIFEYNYMPMQEYANAIKHVLLDYYKLNENICYNRYSLQYSKVKNSDGSWVTTGGYYDSSWMSYNCYAYSIHRYEISPFYSTGFQYQPGDMADDESDPNSINTFSDCATISDLAGLVGKDLLAMGYSNITISNSILSVNASQELICVRMGDVDYHFMHYDQSTDAWYHKPGSTAVLKYNIEPSNSYIWNNERSYYGIEYSPNTYYDSDIKFIRYNKNLVSISSTTSNLTYYLGIKAGKDSLLEINNLTNNESYVFSINSSSSMLAELYDNNMTLINSVSGASISLFSVLAGNVFYLKLNYNSPNIYGVSTINISTHTHDYSNHYIWKNYTQHKAVCACGNSQQKPHVVSADAFNNGQQYATCLLCGGLASSGIVYLNRFNQPFLTIVDEGLILLNDIIVIKKENSKNI